MNKKNILIIIIVASVILLSAEAWWLYDYKNIDGSVEDALQYCDDHNIQVYNVSEISSDDPRYVIRGQTQFFSNGDIKIIIDEDYKDDYGAILYHELYHAINGVESGEPEADAYANSYGYPIHDATY